MQHRSSPGDAPALLGRLHAALDAVGNWDAEALEDAVRRVADDAGVKLGQVGAAVAGGADRAQDITRDFRRARAARARREPWPYRRPDGCLTGSRKDISMSNTAKLDVAGTAHDYAVMVWQYRARRHRYPASFTPKPACSPTIPASPRRQAATRRSPISMATRACSSTAAIRSASSPSSRASWKCPISS